LSPRSRRKKSKTQSGYSVKRSHVRHQMKYWEIIADNLSKAVGVGAASQRLIPTGKRSGLLMRTAMTESVSLCVRMTT
jgi:hypothetical protein